MSVLSHDIWNLAAGRLTPDGEERIRRAFEDPNSAVHRFLQRKPLETYESDEAEGWIGLDDDEGVEIRPVASVRQRIRAVTRNRHFRIAASLIVAVMTLAGTTWAILHEPPLLSDNFNDGSFSGFLWKPQPVVERRYNEAMGISERDGHLQLINRGYLITQEEFKKPISISFDWRWSELGKRKDPLYADMLTVVLRTSADVSRSRPYEVQDGIAVRFYMWGPRATIGHIVDGVETILVNTSDDKVHMPIPADQYHHIRITDDGETIRAFITGPEIRDMYSEKPLLEARIPRKFEEFKGYHIAIYNREFFDSAPHESYIDNVLVRALPQRQAE